MSLDPKQLVPWLDAAAKAADAATAIPGVGGVVAGVIAAALKLASDLASQGHDPIARIERIHAADPALQGVESTWADELRKKFGVTP